MSKTARHCGPMWKTSRIIYFLLAVAIIFVSAITAKGQNIEDYIRIAKQPAWVNAYDVPDYNAQQYKDRDSYYEIIDWQSKLDVKTESFFSRWAEVLNTPAGVEDNSNVRISFDPAYQTIDLHYIRVRRNGEIIDKTDLSEFIIYRKETDRKKLIFDGRMEVQHIVPDVRVGDVLEVAYTISGRNPVIGPHFSEGYQQAYNDVVMRFVQRVILHDDLSVYTASYRDAKDPVISDKNQYQEYFWDLKLPEPVFVDDETPAWFSDYPVYYLSSFDDWAEVGKFFAPLYKVPEKLPNDLEAAVQKIMKDHDDDKTRARAALDFIQRDIRYFAINMGVGGYQPRSVDRIMKRRFGDCKDMTLLLTTMLRKMNIEADPLLVYSKSSKIIMPERPRYGAFDHVVVRAKIGNNAFVLDPTLGEQIGDLDNLNQGGYVDGVIISPRSEGRIEIEDTGPAYFDEYYDSYDLVSSVPDILFTSQSTYYQGSADRIISWIDSSGKKDVEREYLEFYQNSYPSIEQKGDLRFKRDEDNAKVTIEIDYVIKDAWEKDPDDGESYHRFFAKEIASDVPNFKGAKRTTPYAFKHPVRSRQTLDFKIDKSWDIEPTILVEDHDAFYFSLTSTVTENRFKEVYEYRSKQDHITPEDFEKTMKALDNADDHIGLYLRAPKQKSDKGWFATFMDIMSAD